MKFEGPEKPVLSKAQEEADPTLYTPLNSMGPLSESKKYTEKSRRKIFTDGVDEYVKVRSHPQSQQVIARMLKGIINVADIIGIQGNTGNEYYSKILPHKKIQQKTSRSEIEADILLLESVFGDYDRELYAEAGKGMSDTEHHNVRVKDDAVSYFDFVEASLSYGINSQLLIGYENDVLNLLEQRLDQLEERFTGVNGREFLSSIILASGKSLPELFFDDEDFSSIEKFQDLLLNRIKIVRELILRSQSDTVDRKRFA